MIYIFGDSHANFNMKGFSKEHINLYENSITMHRIGRDNQIINFNSNMNDENNIFILFYGEVDCRCHIYKQLNLGRDLNEIIESLVDFYFRTISNNITRYNKIIIGSITPPVNKEWHESINGPTTHEFPILDTDSNRVKYTKLMNKKLEEYCFKYNYTYLDSYNNYSDNNGLLITGKSDNNCHIADNNYVHLKLMDLIYI
jgi:hypothetical protein